MPHLHALLKQAHESLYIESTRLLPVLDQLDPAKHSLGYLYILEACSFGSISKEQASTLVFPIAKFINSCVEEQIRLQPDKFDLRTPANKAKSWLLALQPSAAVAVHMQLSMLQTFQILFALFGRLRLFGKSILLCRNRS
ncbi:hypothetical protein TB1_034393 [Malus domestica]